MQEPPDRWTTAARIERLTLRDTVNRLGCGCLTIVLAGIILMVLVATVD